MTYTRSKEDQQKHREGLIYNLTNLDYTDLTDEQLQAVADTLDHFDGDKIVETVSKDDGLLHELYSINADIDEIKNRLSAFQESVAELIIDKPEKPQIPEGFKAFEATEDGVCPVPNNCIVEAILNNGDGSGERTARTLSWKKSASFPIIAYKVTHVPALKYDKDNLPDKVWLADIELECQSWSLIEDEFSTEFNSTVLRAFIKAGFAYASEPHVDTAKEWGLLPEGLV